MPIIQDVSTNQVASLEETMDYFSSIDIADREALLGGASALRALANNRTFLAQLIVDELKNLDTLQQTNMYSAQVFTLGKGRNFFMRANFWPALNDSVVQVSGPRHFFYDTPHDHNFDFLTVGYHGPGYLSDFFEYDHDSVAGYIGEKIALRYVGREALPHGRIMLYRESIDIHNQLPPESFSISVNVMSDFASKVTTVNQYMLELPSGIITELGNRTSLPLICEAAAEIGDEECMDVLDQLRRTHPYPRGRFSAHLALARLRKQDAYRIWSEAAADPAKYVYVQARIRLAQMEGEALVTA